MKKTLFIITIVLSSQDHKFGKISKEELFEKYHPKDSSASAAVLYISENVSFFFTQSEGFKQQREVHKRIKIYNKDGYKWATEKLHMYKGSSKNKEELTNIKGATYNLKDGKIEKDKLRKDGIFEEKQSELTEISTITMPNIQDGSVIEYSYTIMSPFKKIDDLYFQSLIPINKLEISVATPQFYRYDKLFNDKAIFLPEIVEGKTNKFYNGTSTSRSVRPGEDTTFKPIRIDYFENTLEITGENIPAIKKEPFSGNLDNFISKMSMELSAVLNIDEIVEQTFSTSWEAVSKTIYDSSDFGGQLSKFNFYKDDLEALLVGVEDDFEKAFRVENLVKSKVKWNGFYGKYAQKGIRSAYKNGEGNAADINLMMVSMLRSQGVNANPIILSTRNNGIPLFPSLDGFNYVICSVQKEGQFMLIDATDRYSGNNVLPIRTLNWKGRLVENNGASRWINIQPSKKSVEATMLNVKINNDFTITGKVAKNLTDYNAYFYRDKYVNLTQEDHIKALEKDKGDIEISELNIENTKNITKPIKVSYEYELSDGIDEIGDKLYFSPLLFLATKENPFKLEERQYPIDFVIPYTDKYMVNIMLPDGYVVESMPETGGMQFKDSNVLFQYVIQQNGNYLQLKVQLDINNPLIQPSDYKEFKKFYSKIVEKQAEQIILTKS